MQSRNDETTTTTKPASKAEADTSTDQDLGQAELQERDDEATAKGYIGETVDETPRENSGIRGRGGDELDLPYRVDV